MEFKDVVKKLRKEHKLTQEELALKVDLRRSTYANYERGIRTPSPELLKKLSNYFEVSIEYLLGYEDKRTKLDNYINKIVEQTNNNTFKWSKINDFFDFSEDLISDKIIDILNYNNTSFVYCPINYNNDIFDEPDLPEYYKNVFIVFKDDVFYIFVENDENDNTQDFTFIVSKKDIDLYNPSSIKVTSDDIDLTELHNSILYNIKNIDNNLLDEFIELL